jgi:hypothetical protein
MLANFVSSSSNMENNSGNSGGASTTIGGNELSANTQQLGGGNLAISSGGDQNGNEVLSQNDSKKVYLINSQSVVNNRPILCPGFCIMFNMNGVVMNWSAPNGKWNVLNLRLII